MAQKRPTRVENQFLSEMENEVKLLIRIFDELKLVMGVYSFFEQWKFQYKL